MLHDNLCEILQLKLALLLFFFKVKAEVTNGSNGASLIRVHLTKIKHMAGMLSKSGLALRNVNSYNCNKLNSSTAVDF